MRKAIAPLIALLVLAAALSGCSLATRVKRTMPGLSKNNAAPVTCRAYIPCGMIIPMKAVLNAFEAKNPGIKVEGVYDNAIVLARRIIEKHEKADLFVSPGDSEVGRLEKANLCDPKAKKSVGTFDLVVIVQKGNPLGITKPEDLEKAPTISTPDPELNSVGVSGRQVLTRLGLWSKLEPRMLKTQDAIASHTMVASGKSQAGIAYKNCPLETNPEKLSKSKVAVAFDFDPTDYTKQRCWVTPLKNAGNADAAAKFIAFITSRDGLTILAKNGMTGCLEMAPGKGGGATADASAGVFGEENPKALVQVKAFYPNNGDHAAMKKMILALPQKYPGKASAQFIDFTSDQGYKLWQAAGLTCGAILINNEQTWTYEKEGKPTEVTFKMRVGGEWTEADLNAVIQKIIKEKGG